MWNPCDQKCTPINTQFYTKRGYFLYFWKFFCTTGRLLWAYSLKSISVWIFLSLIKLEFTTYKNCWLAQLISGVSCNNLPCFSHTHLRRARPAMGVLLILYFFFLARNTHWQVPSGGPCLRQLSLGVVKFSFKNCKDISTVWFAVS